MAVLGTSALTYADWAKRSESTERDKIAMIIELLSQTNEIMMDMLVIEGNLPTGHKTTVRTGLPTATWRLLNYGIVPTKSTTAQIVDTVGNLEAESQVDRDIVKLAADPASFRLSESRAFLEGMSQQMASTLIYGSTAVNPERFTGLAPRYNTVSTASAMSAANVIDMGGTGSDNTSIWIVTWGSETTAAISPKGNPTGLQHTDMGLQRVQDVNQAFGTGAYFWAWVDHYKWELGLTVRDWRYNVRLANIDVSDLSGVNAANIINGIVRGLNRLPTTGTGVTTTQTSDAPTIQGSMGRTVIYCNRTVKTFLELQAMNKTNVLLQLGEYNGMPVTRFRGVPVRTVDAILNTESRVV
jgi:hypothetical protein